MKGLKIYSLPAGLLFAFTLHAGAGPAERFGFAGPEIFPIDNQISLLRAADLNENGWTDLVVVNNARSHINLLFNQTAQADSAEPLVRRGRGEINELPPDARFRIESIASEKRIASLVVADLNDNGRPDIAYYGEPRELVVQHNQGADGWSAPKRFPITDGVLSPNGLAYGDLTGNGRTDLVLLAEHHVYLLAQNKHGILAEPVKIPFSGSIAAIQVLDVDGDGRDDLLLINPASPNPLRFRLQNKDGQVGPEIYFTLPPIRSYHAADLDGNGRTELVTIAQHSGRAQVSHFVRQDAEPVSGRFHQGQFHVLPLNRTGKSQRGMVWADVNGDGLADLLVAEPESGQLTLFLQNSDGALAPGRTFPTLSGISQIAVADWTGDGVSEIFLLSSDERQIGVTRLDGNGRIPFPTILRLEGRPLAIAAGEVNAEEGGRQTVLAAILDEGRQRVLVTRTAEGESRTQRLKESFRGNPSAMAFHDVNQNGLADLVVLIPYERIKLLLQAEGEFEEHDVMPPGGNADNPWMSVADIDGNGRAELLLAQRNFIRAVVLVAEDEPDTEGNPSWSFQVKEQINGAASNSRILGAAPVHNSAGEIASLFLLDAERRAVTLCERDESGVWQVVRNIPLPVSGFSGLEAIGLGSAQANSLALLGLNEVAWMSLEGQVWTLAELDGYETQIRDGVLNDVVAGDLNDDGRKDLVFLETARNHLDLVLFEPPHQLVPANRWQVFEERTFRARRNTVPEPREALIADVTGDGRNDLIVLVHDRVLVYPQEAATTTGHSSEETMLVYFGTYTGGASKGIYVSRLDLQSGELTPPEPAGETDNPSFLAIHPNRRFLYAVGEINNFEETEAGSVSAFAIDRENGALSLLNQQSSQGAWPCHITVDADGRYALVANYGGGNAAVLPIKPDGQLGEATALVKHSGSSVNPQRQKAPHAHSINLDPHNRFAFVADLGIDKIMIYQFDSENGALIPNEPPHAEVASGAGPRHFAFRPDGRFAYVINELNCTITAFSYDAERGELKEVQTVSTLPEGESVQSGYSTAEVQVHPSGGFLYGSNRGHNTLAVFRIDEEAGTLKLVQHQSTLGKTPRNFGIDPTGRYLVAANQNSDSVAIFRIDPAGGQLQATGQVLEVPAPVCVKFFLLER